MQPVPTTLRRQVGAYLRRLRGDRTVADVARNLGWSESKLSRIETAHIGITNRDLDRLLKHYGVGDGEARRIRAIAVQSRQRAWWEAYGDVLPTSYETYIGFESEAAEILNFENTVVPGLLQTDEYARAVFQADGRRHDGRPLDGAEIDQKVAVRMARQSVLTREPPPRLVMVLDEAVTRRPIGGPSVQRRQLRRLAEAAERSTIEVRVLPFSVGGHPGLAGSFAIHLFANEEPPIVYCEGRTGGVFRTRSDEVEGYLESFRELRGLALPQDESIAFLLAAARDVG